MNRICSAQILLIEDHEMIRKMMLVLLRQRGYTDAQITVCEDADTALPWLDHYDFAAVISDNNLGYGQLRGEQLFTRYAQKYAGRWILCTADDIATIAPQPGMLVLDKLDINEQLPPALKSIMANQKTIAAKMHKTENGGTRSLASPSAPSCGHPSPRLPASVHSLILADTARAVGGLA